MSEQTPPSAEKAAAIARFHDAMQQCFADPADPAVLQTQQEFLWDIIGRAQEKQTDPRAPEVLQEWGMVVDYLWFQPVDAQLPPGLTFEEVENNAGQPWGEMRLGLEILGDKMFTYTTGLLQPYGLGDLLAVRTANVERHKDTLFNTLQRFLASTPGGQWLQAFSAENDGARLKRLTAQERAQREAVIFSQGTHAVQRQFGSVKGSPIHVRLVPGAQKEMTRQELPLDDEPGRRRIRQDEAEVPRQLAALITRRLIALHDLADPSKTTYEPNKDMLTIYDDTAEPLASYESVHIALTLQDEIGYHQTMGADDLSIDICSEALNVAYSSLGPAASEEPINDVYASVIARVATRYAKIIVKGFSLDMRGLPSGALGLIKMPPADTPYSEDNLGEEGGEFIDFVRAKHVLTDERNQNLDEAARAKRSRELAMQSSARLTPLEERVAEAHQQLLENVRRYLALPETAPDDAIYENMRQWRRYDPMVRCFRCLNQAVSELKYGERQVSRQTLVEVAGILDHIQGLRDLHGQPNRYDPEGYAAEGVLLTAMEQALQPLAAGAKVFRLQAPK